MHPWSRYRCKSLETETWRRILPDQSSGTFVVQEGCVRKMRQTEEDPSKARRNPLETEEKRRVLPDRPPKSNHEEGVSGKRG